MQGNLGCKFDEIVAFAEVEKFIDTPVKRYSSGMQMRLAFAVAAHLEPEILIIDEVLAVGDLRFQKKCVERIKQVSQNGLTILIVSHNMQLVSRLCKRVALLDSGRLVADGNVRHVVQLYMSKGGGSAVERVWRDPKAAPGDGQVPIAYGSCF